MKKAQIHEAFARWSEANPHPVTELEAPNPYCLLVAIVMSAQATDVGVNKATKALFSKVKTPEEMVALGEGQLKDHIKTIGLFNSKAKNVIALSQRLISEYGSEIPRDRDALQTLPGVGRKTANVWLNCVFGEPLIAVDTHVQRVSNRMRMVKAETPLETEKQLDKKVPKEWKQHAHHWLILHGRYICKARKPLCGECMVRDLCGFKGKIL